LLKQRLGSKARRLLAEFAQSVRALIRSIEGVAGPRDPPSAIARLQPILDTGRVFNQIAIKLSTPTSRLISETGKSAQARQGDGQCCKLVSKHRERRELSQAELAAQLEWSVAQLALIEKGESPLEQYAPLLLLFAEMIDQPIFNLFYPCGLPFAELKDYS
jgi:DNA-binding XRE family transcriptional regulator